MPEIPKSIKSSRQLLLQRRGALGAVQDQIRTLLAIQATVNSLLDSDVKVASLKAGCLHLITPSAALATRLKYSQQLLINGLRAQKQPIIISKVKISVRPELDLTPVLPKHHAFRPNEQNAKQIAATAQYIEHEPLRKALLKLSGRKKPTDE